LAIAFRDVNPTIRWRLIAAADKLLLELSEEPPAAFPLDGLKRLTIDTGSTAVASGNTVRFVEGFHLRHVDKQPPETMRRFRLRPR